MYTAVGSLDISLQAGAVASATRFLPAGSVMEYLSKGSFVQRGRFVKARFVKGAIRESPLRGRAVRGR